MSLPATTSGRVPPEARDQTHGELVYRPLQFHKARQHFIGTHHETLSVELCAVIRVYHADGSVEPGSANEELPEPEGGTSRRIDID